MTFKKLTALTLTLVLSLSALTACSGGGSTPTPAPGADPTPAVEPSTEPSAAPEKPTKLVMGTSADYPPYEFHILENGEDKIVGIDVSIAQAIADDMGAELEIVDMNFDNLLTLMGQGNCDMVLACIESTPDREAAADGSDPYYEDLPPMVVVKKENVGLYTSMDDFTGKSVGAQSGTNKALIVTGEDEEVAPVHMTGANAVLLASVNDMINQLVYDKVDALVLDGAVAVQYTSSNDQLAVVEGLGLEVMVSKPCVWVADGDPKGLLPSINATIAKLKEEGKVEQFIEQAEKLSDEAMS